MKVSDQFILREIAGDSILIPAGKNALSMKGLIVLSEGGAFVYHKLKNGCEREDLIAAMTAEYDVSEAEAAMDIDAFLSQMRQLNILMEDDRKTESEK